MGDVVEQQIPASTLRHLLCLKESLVELKIKHRFGAYFADEIEFESRNFRPARWTQEHIDVFRQLTRLGELDPFGGRWSEAELIMLAAEPAPAHLRYLLLNSPPTTSNGIESLVRLPLTGVNFDVFSVDAGPVKDLSFLGRMATPKSIRISFSFALAIAAARPCHFAAQTDEIVDALARCTRLTELRLFAVPITNDHLCCMLPSLTNLRWLAVDSPDLIGLSFASTIPHLARTLEELTLSEPTTASMPLDEVRHLRALTSLRYLSLSLVVPSSTPEEAIVQAHDELDFNKPTFRQDLWPHMGHTYICVKNPDASCSADDDDGQTS